MRQTLCAAAILLATCFTATAKAENTIGTENQTPVTTALYQSSDQPNVQQVRWGYRYGYRPYYRSYGYRYPSYSYRYSYPRYGYYSYPYSSYRYGYSYPRYGYGSRYGYRPGISFGFRF